MNTNKTHTINFSHKLVMKASIAGTVFAPEMKYREEGTAAAIAMHLVDAVRMGRMAMEEIRQTHITFRRIKTNSKKVLAATQRLNAAAAQLAFYSDMEASMRLELSKFGPMTVRDDLLAHGITFHLETMLHMAEEGKNPAIFTMVELLPGDTITLTHWDRDAREIHYLLARGEELVEVSDHEDGDMSRSLRFYFSN